MSNSPVSITLAEKNIEKIDALRGLVKRSTYIDSIISDYLKNFEKKKGGSLSISATDSKIVSVSSTTKKGDMN